MGGIARSHSDSMFYLLRNCCHTVFQSATLFKFLVIRVGVKWYLIEGVFIFLAAPQHIPQLGIEPEPPVLEVQGLKHWTTREVPSLRF